MLAPTAQQVLITDAKSYLASLARYPTGTPQYLHILKSCGRLFPVCRDRS